jgi:hypothetical protein
VLAIRAKGHRTDRIPDGRVEGVWPEERQKERIVVSNAAHSTGSGVGRSWPEVLGALTDGRDLDSAAAEWAMDEIMSDNATAAQIAAFGVALKMKGPTPEELRGLAEGMYQSISSAPAATGRTP